MARPPVQGDAVYKNTFLALATGIGSAICWWPGLIWQNTRGHSPVPALCALVFIGLITGLSIALSGGRWLRFCVLSPVGTFFGVLSGGMIWPSEDGIAQSYLLFGALIATIAVALVSLIAALAARLVLCYRRR